MATKDHRLCRSRFHLFSVLLLGIGIVFIGSAASLAQPPLLSTLTPDSPEQANLLAVENTRTAIALTRDPSLATPRTPVPIQLTATAIEADLSGTSTALAQPKAHDDLMQTATAVIARATETMAALTQNPLLALTPSPTYVPQDCTQPALMNLSRTDLANRIQDALSAVDMSDAFFNVVTVGVSTGGQCQDFTPLQTTFVIHVPVNDLSTEFLATRTTTILSVLDRVPSQVDFGIEPARLLVRFDNQGTLFVIDTGYENARKAYQEHLTGTNLLEALGTVFTTQ